MARDTDGIRRPIAFSPETWRALDGLAKGRVVTVQALAQEAFRDLLKKPHRPITLTEMLRESARSQPGTITCPRRGGSPDGARRGHSDPCAPARKVATPFKPAFCCK